jgi:zinc protease
MYTVEPPQQGESLFVLRRAGQLGLVEMAWHIPETRHADTPALTVLDTILSAGVTSRLYQALIETQMAVDVGAQSSQFRDPGLFTIDMTLRPGVKHEDAERVALDVIEKLKTEEIAESELQKVKNIIITQMIYVRDSPFGVVNVIGEFESMDEWKLYVDLPRQVEQVTNADIRRVVNTYFTDDNRTVGWFIPKEELQPEGDENAE